MPQLNPAPWLPLLILTWSALLLYMTKTTQQTFHKQPTSPQSQMGTTPIWHWPWP